MLLWSRVYNKTILVMVLAMHSVGFSQVKLFKGVLRYEKFGYFMSIIPDSLVGFLMTILDAP